MEDPLAVCVFCGWEWRSHQKQFVRGEDREPDQGLISLRECRLKGKFLARGSLKRDLVPITNRRDWD